MMLEAHHDFETGSALDLRKAGVHRYAKHPSTRIWCMSWSLGSAPPLRWRPGAPDPAPLLDHIRSGGIVKAHNAIFERTIWNDLLRVRYCPWWPELRAEQQDCTQARVATIGIPQSLDVAAQVLGARQTKDKEGHALMRKMARPRRVNPDGTLVWWDAPELLDRLGAYCDQDVIAESELDTLAPELSPSERRVWLLDQRINDVGVRLDRAAIEHAIKVREIAKAKLNEEMQEITGGAVLKCTEVAKFVAWIREQGIACESVAKGEQEDLLLAADVEQMPHVRRAIELRQEASKTSTAKLDAMLHVMGDDDRARGLLQYHGASTGRWAGRLIQPQNLYRIDPERDGNDIGLAVDVLLRFTPIEAYQMLKMLFDKPMTMLAKCLRTMIVAAAGNTLKGADLSNIESRIAAWITDEEWKVRAFREYDAGRGPDLYRVAYARSFGVDVSEVTSQQRQIGKVEELALGYQGSVGSFISMGANYGLKPEKLVAPVAAADPDAFSTWMDRYATARDKHGLPQDQWAAIRVVVQGWRAAHPKLVQAWWDLQDAAVEACSTPGASVFVLNGRVCYLWSSRMLWCRLPSGRLLAYFNARVISVREQWVEMPDGTRHDESDLFEREIEKLIMRGGVRKQRIRKRVDYEGFDSEKKRWGVFSLYGGMQFNHIVQATARDVMVGGILRAEAAGYTPVLTVHDEGLFESPKGHGSAAELERLMTAGEDWLVGCPLAAKAWEGERYAK